MKKNILALLLSVIVLLFLSACGKAAEKPVKSLNAAANIKAVPVAVRTGAGYKAEVSDGYDHVLVSLIYPIIALDEKEKKTYPELDSAFQQLNKQKKESLLKRYDEMVADIYERLKYNPDAGNTENTIDETILVRRADTSVVSLLFKEYYYAGGAHGGLCYWGENYDTKTGKRLELSDVVTDMKLLPDLVQKQLDKFWGEVVFYDDMDLKKFFQNTKNISWVLDYNGLTIFFNSYDIAPYAAGMQVVTLTYKENPMLVKEKYRLTPFSYGVELSCDNPFFYDFNGDGVLDKLLISGTKQNESLFAEQAICLESLFVEQGIYLNDQVLKEKILAYINPVFIHTAGGNYLYLEYQLDEGRRQLIVYDLNSGSAKKVKKLDDIGVHYIAVPSEEVYYPNKAVLTDPDNLVFDTYTDLIGVIIGYASYSVGPDGVPSAKNNLYTFDMPSRFNLTLKQKLKFDIIAPESGEVIGSKVLNAGEMLYYYRNDNKSFADFLLPDGSIGRVRIETNGSVKTINGMALEKVLSDVIFVQ